MVMFQENLGHRKFVTAEFACPNLCIAQYDAVMIDLDWMTVLICRTIGAARGRAARGSPNST